MNTDEFRQAVDVILHPESDGDSYFHQEFPHSCLTKKHGLDTSYFKGTMSAQGDRAFERLLEDENDPLHDTFQSITVPYSLTTAALELFGDSLVAYRGAKRKHGVYRYYPSILMTIWSAFESWVRIYSEILVKVAENVPEPVKNSLLEERVIVDENGKIGRRNERRPVLDRYWLLLKYGCNIDFDRGGRIWQCGKQVADIRDNLVHYDVKKAPPLKALDIWTHMESVMLLFIAPSTVAKRTLFHWQFECFNTLAELYPLISQFEERPLHKGWSKEAQIFICPFDGVDDVKYPRAHTLKREK